MQLTEEQTTPLGYAHLGVQAHPLGLTAETLPETIEVLRQGQVLVFTRWRGVEYVPTGGVDYRCEGDTLTIFTGNPADRGPSAASAR